MCDYCECGRLISPIVSDSEIGIPEIEVDRGSRHVVLYVDVMGGEYEAQFTFDYCPKCGERLVER